MKKDKENRSEIETNFFVINKSKKTGKTKQTNKRSARENEVSCQMKTDNVKYPLVDGKKVEAASAFVHEQGYILLYIP